MNRFVKSVANALNSGLNAVGVEISRPGANRASYLWHNAYKKRDLRQVGGFSDRVARVHGDRTTLLGYDRLYTLWTLLQGIPLKGVALAEVGTYRGGSAHFMASVLEGLGASCPLLVFDTFEGHAVVDSDADGPHEIGQFSDTSFEAVSAYLSPFKNVKVFKGDFLKTSATTPALDGRFALVHADVDVYSVTKHILETFADRMVPGGVIVVDDYGFTTCPGAKKAVDEFAVTERNRYRLIELLTAQALLVRHS